MDKVRGFLRKLGPGIITGAADDDPSGIATYSVAGASFGYGLLWTALFSFPLMTAVQETCGRIGLVTKRGLAEITKEHFPKPVVLIISFILFAANTFNIGADIAGMTAAVRLLIPLPEIVVGISMAGLMTFLIIKMKYDRIVVVFKWLTIALFAYVITFFLVRQNLVEIIRSTVIPTVTFNKDYLLTVLAIFGTTISPYLFFWQTSDEAQNEKLEKKSVSRFSLRVEREDTIVGMLFSNLVMYFIIATVAATLFSAGIRNIGTAAEAAQALRPLAGDAAFLLFAVGIVGTGMLAIPILAGSAGYALAETFGFHEGLNKTFKQAPGFYVVIILSMVLGFGMNLLGISPIKYLFYSAVLNGMVSPIMIGLLLIIANNKKIMGTYINGWVTNLLTVIAFIVMAIGAVAIFVIH
jgi:NRAMP (natural resistance-associated macrophage protein)-like metal ion transporter